MIWILAVLAARIIAVAQLDAEWNILLIDEMLFVVKIEFNAKN